ncbi:MAG TPA: glycosyl hydrolase 115 family protein [Candidatus Tetragenococcus pullicola]|nr:glycosyl hydrolase 115 family protein [Candidatus Tetragenococcus pullicola]
MKQQFTIYNQKKTTPVLMDREYTKHEHSQRSYQQILRATQDLRQDIGMVTGAIDYKEVQQCLNDSSELQEERLKKADSNKRPELIYSSLKQTGPIIIVGSLEESEILQNLYQQGKLPQAKELEDVTEGYLITTVQDISPTIPSALVIAGSDARGTIYGIYQVSEWIGVSPWYWYSDVPIERKEQIELSFSPVFEKSPSVRYRGIFINDEERTIDWIKEKFATELGAPNVFFYRHVFELLLRLRLNTLWPAMHEGTTAFNVKEDEDGISINAKEAAKYGIIMSASHCEMMLRNNVGEWQAWFEKNKNNYTWQTDDWAKAFDYTLHKEQIIQYWRERLIANKEFESILALGIRGVHDGAYANSKIDETFGNDVAMLKDVITEQRKLIEEVYGDVDAVPQVLIPYKEIGNLYNAGLKDFIDEKVMLMWAEDNFGYVRQVPNETERARTGGKGIYYHQSYWGHPKSYLWLNSFQFELMIEELNKAYHTGAKDYWILNVGDIKPGEIGMECFAKMAWQIDAFDEASLKENFFMPQLTRDYHLSDTAANQAADVLLAYSQLNGTKRAEFFGTENPSAQYSALFKEKHSFPFSVTDAGDEGQRLLDHCHELLLQLDALQKQMSEEQRNAFYQQIYHAIASYTYMAEQFVYFWKYRLAVEQGRYGSAKKFKELAFAGQEKIKVAEEVFWQVNQGKWKLAIGFSHPIAYYGGVNEGIVMLKENHFAALPKKVATIAAFCEGEKEINQGNLCFHSRLEQSKFIDVFSRDGQSRKWHAKADAWINLSQDKGITATQDRLFVTIDWQQVTTNKKGKITIFSEETGAEIAVFRIDATVSEIEIYENSTMEANGYVLIEAPNVTESTVGEAGEYWQFLPNIGQRKGVMKAMPDLVTSARENLLDTAKLYYRIYFESTGRFNGKLYRIPTLNEGFESDGSIRTCDLAIGLDNDTPTNLNGNTHWGGTAWDNGIMHMTEPLDFTITVQEPGWHVLVIYQVDPSIMFDRIAIETRTGALGNTLVGPVASPNSFLSK